MAGAFEVRLNFVFSRKPFPPLAEHLRAEYARRTAELSDDGLWEGRNHSREP